MKLAVKLAGVFATGAFLMVALTTYVGGMDFAALLTGQPQQMLSVIDISLGRPLRIFTLAVPSGFLAGFLGYLLGNVFDNPKGEIKKKTKAKQPSSPLDEMLAKEGLTGDETFLEALDDTAISDATNEPLSAGSVEGNREQQPT